MAKVSKEIRSLPEYQEYMRLAHRADQRMLRLERLSTQEYYTGVLTYGYKYAEKTIKDLQGGKRFRSVTIRNEEDLRNAMAGVKKFLEAPSSTKQSIKRTYQKRADTINEKFGTDLTWQQMADAWQYIDSTKEGRLNYRTAMRTYEKLVKQADSESILEQIADGVFKNEHKIFTKAQMAYLKSLDAESLIKLGLKIVK